MRYVRGSVVLCALLLTTATLAWGEEDSVVDGLKGKLAERLKSYLYRGVLENEELSKYVDREYWRTIKDDFGSRIKTVVSEDAFIQAVLPILESVRTELQEVLKLTLEELVFRSGSISTRLREAIQQLNQKIVQAIEQGIAKVKALAETRPEQYRALIDKLGEAVGNSASNIAEETTLLAGTVWSIVSSSYQQSTSQ